MTLQETMIARTIAPEDIRPWMYVAVASILDEWVLRTSDCAIEKPGIVVARVRLLPVSDLVPLKVKAACLPFVLVSTPNDGARMLDVRQHELVELPEAFARKAMKALRAKQCRGGDDVRPL
jgi:hypothetical protein